MKIWRITSDHELMNYILELWRSMNYSKTLSLARCVLVEECKLNHCYYRSEKDITDDPRIRFLLAQLLMDSFQDKLTIRDVKSALRNLPQGSDAYDIAYHAAMERICAQGEGLSRMAKKILTWILCAHRPLSILELLHALAVEPGDTEIDEDNILETDQLLTVCAGLVTIDEQSDNVRFIHYTTQEYLQRNQQTWLPHAKIEIARSCTTYLLLHDLAAGPCSTKADYACRMERFALLRYAAVYWGPHMSILDSSERLPESDGLAAEALAFLCRVGCLNSASQVLSMSRGYHCVRKVVANEGIGHSGLHWIAEFGLVTLLKRCFTQQSEFDPCDLLGRTPLSWAAEHGNIEIVKLLLETGKVDMNLEDWHGETPFSWAVKGQKEAIVKLLLETHSVILDNTHQYGSTTLSWAIGRGHVVVIELLLATGKVNLGARDLYSESPLLLATMEKSELMVRLLLEGGVLNVDPKDYYGLTPLSWAAGNGSEAIVKLLLETGEVDIDSRDKHGVSPLLRAAANGHESIVKLLLETGKVNIGLKDNSGGTALSVAERNGHEIIARLLSDAEVAVSKDQHAIIPVACEEPKGEWW